MLNTRSHRLNTTFGVCFLFSALLPFAFGQNPPSESAADKDRVRFASGVQIPAAPIDLPVFRLSRQKSPADFAREVLPSAAPESKELQPLAKSEFLREKRIAPPKEMLGAFQGKHVAVLLDPNSGDMEVFPSIDLLKPADTNSRHEIERIATDKAREIFARQDIIGKDATRAVVGNLTAVYGATLEHKQGATSSSKLFLMYVPLRRYVESYPVYGLGSRALVAIGTDGNVRGFIRRWQLASPEGKTGKAPTRSEVQQAIIRQLTPLTKESEVLVKEVKLAYYDGNRAYLQPVYRFKARVHHFGPSAPSKHQGDDDFVIGYVPIGKELDPLPVLGKRTGPSPVFAKSRYPSKAALKPNDPSVGRYVVRNDDDDWVDNANEFMDGLNSMPAFTDSQYFWAEPFEFIGDQGDFVNHVELALNEVHGNWWGFSTTGNSGDWVDMTTIPAPGYGSAAGGSLAYWVIHSCEVIPSPDDTPNWPDPWWNIFGGLHSVVGYRTIMWIDDDVTGPYAESIAWLAPVVGGWLNEVSGADAYDDGDTEKTHNGRDEPVGRASTISACGTEDESVYWSALHIPAASCLRIFWFPD